MNIRKVCLISLAFVWLLAGCSYETGEFNEEYIIKLLQKQDNAIAENLYVKAGNDISVPLPQSDTSIYINRLGYNTADNKKAIFLGEKEGESFNVVNADTKEVVYTGKIEEGTVKTGDFSKVTTSGRYYIETDYVGRSYYFDINESLYSELFVDLLGGFYDKEEDYNWQSDKILDACFGMDIVIYAMQCNGDVFGGESNIVEQLLYMSDELISLQESDGSILEDYETTAAFCGIIAMCGNEFGKYESTVDETYRESALKAWNWLEKNSCDTEERKEERFYAASQLYNLIKTTDYKEISEEYLNDRGSDYSKDSFVFFGAIAYMNSKADVDMSLCTYIMMDMIEEADRICDNISSDKVFAVGVSDIDEVMTDTAQICFFNYLVPSSEYISALSAAIEYVGGYNTYGINYMEEYPENKDFEYKAVMLFAISHILST